MPSARSATTAFEKPLRVLKAMSDPRNNRLTDIARAAGLDVSSAFRALQILIDEGFIRRNESSRSYSYGEESYVLALALHVRRDLRSAARSSMQRLAVATGEMVSLLIRSGYESVCVDLEAGGFPLHMSPMAVGIRRPLGVGAASMALIAWSEREDLDAVLAHVGPILERHSRITSQFILEEAEAARARGYTRQYGTIEPDIGGLALPIRGIDGRVCGALSISGLVRNLSIRERLLVDSLKGEIDLIERALRRAPRAP